MTRNAIYALLIPTLYLATCCTVYALDHPTTAIRAPILDKPVVDAEWKPVRRTVQELSNPTPLSDELYRAVLAACNTYEVPVSLALGLIEAESSFREDAVSPAGCYGLCQLNPDYFPSSLTAAENIGCGMEYLGSLLDHCENAGAALTAYNAGNDTGDRDYANAALEAAERWEEKLCEAQGKAA